MLLYISFDDDADCHRPARELRLAQMRKILWEVLKGLTLTAKRGSFLFFVSVDVLNPYFTFLFCGAFIATFLVCTRPSGRGTKPRAEGERKKSVEKKEERTGKG